MPHFTFSIRELCTKFTPWKTCNELTHKLISWAFSSDLFQSVSSTETCLHETFVWVSIDEICHLQWAPGQQCHAPAQERPHWHGEVLPHAVCVPFPDLSIQRLWGEYGRNGHRIFCTFHILHWHNLDFIETKKHFQVNRSLQYVVNQQQWDCNQTFPMYHQGGKLR